MKVPPQMPPIPAHARMQITEERHSPGKAGSLARERAGGEGLPNKVQDEMDEIWTALRQVVDPELDQSVVDLGFVSHVQVADAAAGIVFRLPTFWCSANFAWIMAEDIRLALQALPWLRRADIRLVDHFAADRINRGMAAGQSFRATFGVEAGGDLAALRATFRRKAFLGRMSALIEALRKRRWSDERIVRVEIAEVADLRRDPSIRPLVDRHLELRAFFGGSCETHELAFRTAEGDAIPTAGLSAYLRDIRMTRRGVEANGEMCRILLAERYRDPALCGDRGPGNPTGYTPPPAGSVLV
jgi:metal-sulfur cluster biosynthetic enzyme